jgi:hypothetical protein
MLLDISTVIVFGALHCPADGVNVYVVEPIAEVFINDGDQVPETPLRDEDGKLNGVAFTQYGPT